jgi:ribonuclease HII
LKTGQNRRGLGPDLQIEQDLISRGYKLVAGIDEVGRGALAGPVVAAAVVIPCNNRPPNYKRIRDSKEMKSSERETAFDVIISWAVDIGIGIVSPQIIDEINILGATRRAMRQAIKNLSLEPDFLLIDGAALPRSSISQQGIIKGDKRCLSIACASIIAKVIRDKIMVEYDRSFPDYGFAIHKGYGTKRDMLSLIDNGPIAIHRFSFAPVRNLARLI